MNPVETMWEFVVSELQGTEFRTPIVVGACILCTVVGLLRKLERWRYKVAAVMDVGFVAVEWNLFMKWNYITIYLLVGFLILFPVLCFFHIILMEQISSGRNPKNVRTTVLCRGVESFI